MAVIELLKEKNADFFLMHSGNVNFSYATKFKSSATMFYLIGIDGTDLLLLPEMELGRALRESRVKEIASFEKLGYEKKLKELGSPRKAIAEILVERLKEGRAKKVLIPNEFPAFLALELQKIFEVETIENPFYKLRAIKRAEELEKIKQNCSFLLKVFHKFYKRIKSNKKITCDLARRFLEKELFSYGLIAEDTICSTGKLSADPHELGKGKIEDHLLVDVFPRNLRTGYCADFTRTILIRENSEIEEMLKAVIEAQKKAISMLKDGVNGKDVHNAVKDCLKSHGYETRGGEGFIHSTGHGVGLEVHEEPRLSDVDVELKSGMVVTIEPGLYYRKIGGVRVEDLVVIKKDGCEILTPFESFLAVYNP
ncbi:MAG: Xaa-Pro peptidase family protein [Archaeoglobaceae archaeon]|nr:Xaa-Pro peptidase family protein [Archaeoglobaceae archaeon]MDW8128756.1 Xaa-Pro peptidase family protein [Archaeoglobaceae archaeon]